MSQNKLSQNEIFRMMGNYPVMPPQETEPVGKSLTAEEQLSILKRNIRKSGIMASSKYWKNYSDPFLRCALKLAASGLDKTIIRSLLEASAMSGDKTNLKEQQRFNDRILKILFFTSTGKEL